MGCWEKRRPFNVKTDFMNYFVGIPVRPAQSMSISLWLCLWTVDYVHPPHGSLERQNRGRGMGDKSWLLQYGESCVQLHQLRHFCWSPESNRRSSSVFTRFQLVSNSRQDFGGNCTGVAFSAMIIGWFSNRTETSVDNGARITNAHKIVEIDSRSDYSTRSRGLKWRSRSVAKSAQ